jgi:hypothetical protein
MNENIELDRAFIAPLRRFGTECLMCRLFEEKNLNKKIFLIFFMARSGHWELHLMAATDDHSSAQFQASIKLLLHALHSLS